MKENKKYYGIYLDKKIPQIKDDKNKYNNYYSYIKLQFEGKAYIIENDEIKEELKNNSKYKKSGKHTIKFINKDNEIYYININIRKIGLLVLFFIFLLLLILIALTMLMQSNSSSISEDAYLINQSDNFNIDLEGNTYVFDINFENTNFQKIELTNKVSKKNIIYPGASGYINILISTKNGNKDMKYLMEIKDENNKPKYLKFEYDGTIYNSMQELSKAINGTITKDNNEIIKIKWFWDYDNEDDLSDTNDGINLLTYQVFMRMTGSEKE